MANLKIISQPPHSLKTTYIFLKSIHNFVNKKSTLIIVQDEIQRRQMFEEMINILNIFSNGRYQIFAGEIRLIDYCKNMYENFINIMTSEELIESYKIFIDTEKFEVDNVFINVNLDNLLQVKKILDETIISKNKYEYRMTIKNNSNDIEEMIQKNNFDYQELYFKEETTNTYLNKKTDTLDAEEVENFLEKVLHINLELSVSGDSEIEFRLSELLQEAERILKVKK